jgi:ADP-heptose:LPS heptosyltransferase
MHFTDFLASQLRAAGVPAASAPDLRWLDAPVEKFTLPRHYAVLIPGCSPNAPHKRWPAQNFAELSRRLKDRGIPSVTVGTSTDAKAVAGVKALAPDIIDLCGQTTLFELAGILRQAKMVIGNDTGPLHMAAHLGVPVCALFSGRSSPVWSKPIGPHVQLRQSGNLEDLGVAEVLGAIDLLDKQ